MDWYEVTVIYESETRWDMTRLPRQWESSPPHTAPNRNYRMGFFGPLPHSQGRRIKTRQIETQIFFFFFFNNITAFSKYLYSLHFTCVHILRADASPRRQEGSPPSTAPNRNYRVGYIGHPPCPRRRHSEATAQHTIDLARNGNSGCANENSGCAKCHFWWKSPWKLKNFGNFRVCK